LRRDAGDRFVDREDQTKAESAGSLVVPSDGGFELTFGLASASGSNGLERI